MKSVFMALVGAALFAALPAAAEDMPLYDRLGGAAALDAVINEMTAQVIGDRRINVRFARSDIKQVVLLFKGRLCKLAADKCVGPGPSPLPATAPFTLTSQSEFDALIDDMGATLDKFRVTGKERAEALEAIATLKPLVFPSAA